MKEFNYKNQAKNLPDSFAKGADSNNYKILEVEKNAVDSFRTDLQAVHNSLDLNGTDESGNPYVYGKTLDLYGEMVNQARGTTTDEQYIMLIRAKINRNMASGDYPSILKALSMTFNCEPSQIHIEETDEPCTVKSITIPMDIIGKSGFTKSQIIAIIKSLLPVCVTLETTLSEGTFEFSDQTDEMSDTAGFGDLEDETVGGYFGDIISEEDEQPLPI